MTSPVDTSVKHFRSDMLGAPVLSGSPGSLIALLDACLVDGFGAKSVSSLVVVSGIATLTFAGGASAAAVDSVILVSGSTPGALNGEQKVLSVSTTTVTFATAQGDVTATGTIAFKIAPLGFTRVYTGTNKVAYRSADPATTGMYLRIDDTADRCARVIGYESMSDIDTGVGLFPTSAQKAGGGYWAKSAVSSSYAVGWTIVGDGRVFYLHFSPVQGNAASPAFDAYVVGALRGFGDMVALRPGGDAYACVLAYSNVDDGGNDNTNGTFDMAGGPQQLAFPREYTGLGTGVLSASRTYSGDPSRASGCDDTFGNFPSVIDGAMLLAQRFTSVGTTPRTRIPGIYTVPQALIGSSFSHRSLLDGTGPLVGRRLLGLQISQIPNPTLPSNITYVGLTFLDITGPWR